MAAFPPGDITVLDRFGRSDGNVWAGAGATLWNSIGRDGAASHLRIVDGKLKVSAQGGGLTNESTADFIRGFKVLTLGGGFGVSFGYRWTGSGATGQGYFWSLAGGTWRFYRVDAGVLTEIGNQSVDGMFANCRVAFRVIGSTHEVYVGTSRTFPETPAATFTEGTYTSAGAVLIEMDNTSWALDDYFTASNVAPSSGVTIIVDPDHPDASDLYNRTEASDPDTPMRTVQEAAWLAQAAPGWHDTILVKVCETEDLGDANDPHLQPALDYRSTDRSANAEGWPFGDNGGNQPIILQGDVDPDHGFVDLPKIKKFSSRGLNNWVIQDLQLGYDVDSGFDWRTLSEVERVTDITWRRCLATGGLAWVRHWTNGVTVEDCKVRGILPPEGSSPGIHDGSGIRLDSSAAEGTDLSVGQLSVTGTHFQDIQGDDAIGVGGLYQQSGYEAIDADFDMLVQLCVFENVAALGEFHTDSIQVLAVRRCVVDQCIFMTCDSALIASDFRNGYLQFTRSLTIGCFTPVQIQGTDEVLISQCTFDQAATVPKDASILFYDRASLPAKTLLTCVNNVIGGFYMRDRPINDYFREGSVIETNVVMTSPGLVTSFGTNLPGVAEFGHSDRLDVIPNDSIAYGTIPRNWELANSPITSPGIGQGQTTDLGEDLFGRAYADPPDVGCFQSDPGTLVTPVARPPYVLSRTPAINATGVSATFSPTATLYPVPGNEIDAATVSTSSAFIKDAANFTIPAVVTLSAPVDGAQTITINAKVSLDPDVDGSLFPLATYTVHLTGAIEDTDGSALAETVWSFRVVGPASPAISDPTGEAPVEFTAAVASGRTTNGCVVTFNASALDLTPVGMKQLQGFFDRLTMDTAGSETTNTSATLTIGPLE